MEPGECLALDARRRGGRQRQAGPVRDPGSRGNGDASRRRAITDDGDGELEVLTPGLQLGRQILAGIHRQHVKEEPVEQSTSTPTGEQAPMTPLTGTPAPSTPTNGEPAPDTGAASSSQLWPQAPAAQPDTKEEEVELPGEMGEPGEHDPEVRARRAAAADRKPKSEDRSTQEGVGGKEGWRHEHVSRVMMRPGSEHEAARKLAIQRLHIRRYHLPATHMQPLMRAAKAPKGAINEVPSLVQGCDICRQWQKPPPHTQLWQYG